MGHVDPDLDGHLPVLPLVQRGSGRPGAAGTPGRSMCTREAQALTSWAAVRAVSQGDAICTFSLFFLLFFMDRLCNMRNFPWL